MNPVELERWIDRQAVDRNGSKVGTIADIYVDDATGEPEWIAVHTGLFGSRISFVPLAGAMDEEDRIHLAYEKSMVKDSPNVEADGQLTEEEEERLYRHYGMTYRRSGHGASLDLNAELRETGSATITAEVTPEVAVTRLRRRDAMAVESIDLRADEVVDVDAETAASDQSTAR